MCKCKHLNMFNFEKGCHLLENIIAISCQNVYNSSIFAANARFFRNIW